MLSREQLVSFDRGQLVHFAPDSVRGTGIKKNVILRATGACSIFLVSFTRLSCVNS